MCWQLARITHNAPQSYIGLEMWVVAVRPIIAHAVDPIDGKTLMKMGQYCTNIMQDDSILVSVPIAKAASTLMFVPSDDVELLPCFAEDVSIIPYRQWNKQRGGISR